MYRFYRSPTTLAEALALKAQYGESARIIAGGTDLIIEMERNVRAAPDGGELGLIDVTRIPGLAEIWEADGWIHLGPLVTHNQCAGSALIVEKAFPLARACWEVGAPPIRNRATVAGNIITASPANDSIVPLMALDATISVQSAARGERTLPIEQFITGFRKVNLAADEILTRISLRPLAEKARGNFIKLGLRRAQAISVLSVAAVLDFEDGESVPKAMKGSGAETVRSARISLGAVAPMIVRATGAEDFLTGRPLTNETIAEAARRAVDAASPIDDIRGSADYRRAMVDTLTARILRQIRDGREREGWLQNPVMLWGNTDGKWPITHYALRTTHYATVNGQAIELPGGMTLLDSLREAGFTGVKEGCAEGECGACAVFLDGMAVMSCLVPAERAAGSQVVTVEGLGTPAQMHPVQAALVRSGGVQCGYCTPGFVISAAKLLEERPHPTRGEAQEAIAGNLCRCTGYRKIIDAVVMAGTLAENGHKGNERG